MSRTSQVSVLVAVLFNILFSERDGGIAYQHVCWLLITPSYVLQSACWREGMLSRRIWIRLRVGFLHSLRHSTKTSARCCICIGAIPRANTSWTENGLRAAVTRRTQGCWQMRRST